jgi:hypothetical protein
MEKFVEYSFAFLFNMLHYFTFWQSVGVYVQLTYRIRYLGVRNTLQQCLNMHSKWKLTFRNRYLGLSLQSRSSKTQELMISFT